MQYTHDPRGQFFDERAATWEEKCYPPAVRERLAELVADFGIERGDTVLDMGSGPGILVPHIGGYVGEAGRIVALDASLEMMRVAGQKEPGCPYMCMQATAMRIPLASQSVDQVICFACFPHFSSKAEALKEMARVLKPGGNLVVAHLLSRDELGQHHKTHSAVADDMLPDTGTMYALFAEGHFTRPTIEERPGRYLARATVRH